MFQSSLAWTPLIFSILAISFGFLTLLTKPPLAIRVAAFCLLLVAVPCVWQTSLGLPRPIALDPTRPCTTIVSHFIDEPDSIYLWARGDDRILRSYTLPFRQDLALQLQGAAESAAKHHLRLRMGDCPKPATSMTEDDRESPTRTFYPEAVPPDPYKSGGQVPK